MRRKSAVAGAIVASLVLTGSAYALTLHVQHRLTLRGSVQVRFSAQPLPEGGYYYAVAVLRPYKHYTRKAPPPCAVSSNMQRTDYGYPGADGTVRLALTPSRSRAGHWCRGGSYEGAVYAVPHKPPCNSTYPCTSEPYEYPCAGVRPGCVLGVVILPREWVWPEPLPTPRASGTSRLARFVLRFPSR